MALEVIGVEYTDLRGRTVDFPIGNTGNTVTARYRLRNSFRVEVSQNIGVTVTKIGDKLILNGQPSNWEDYGIVAGDLLYFSLSYNDGVTSGNLNDGGGILVTFINGNQLFLASDPDPTQNNIVYNTIGNVKQLRIPEGFDIFFNIAESANPTRYSLIDNEVQHFQIDNFNFAADGQTFTLPQIGNKSGGSAIEASISMVAGNSGEGTEFIVQFKYRYPHYLFPDVFDQDATVTPFVRFEALAQFANLNAKNVFEYAPEGNIGYFDQHFSDGNSEYAYQSIVWKKLNNTVISSMDYANPSKFEIEIEGNFDVACGFNLGWFWVPQNESDYEEKPVSHDETLMLVTKTSGISTIFGPETLIGYSNSDGAQLTITNLSYSVTGSGPGATLKVTGHTIPNANFTDFFEARPGDRDFRFWVDCEQSFYNSDWNSGKSVNVTTPVQEMIKTVVPLGVWDDIALATFYDHADTSYPAILAYEEDDVNALIRFRIPRNTLQSHEWVSVSGVIEAFNTSTGESFELERKTISIAESPSNPWLPDGTFPIDVTQSRGFKLPSGTLKNEVHLKRRPSIDNSFSFGLQFNYGFLVDWRYWVALAGVNPAFFSSQNKDWFNFQANGWALRFSFELTNELGTYKNNHPFRIRQYEDYIGASSTKFYKLDGTQINSPLQNEVIRVEITHDLPAPYVWAPDYWANMTVEPFEGGPRWLLSSFTYPLDAPNPLFPLPGESGVKITINADKAITECLFDPTKINGATGLSFTGRIQGNEKPEIGGKFIFQNGSGILLQDGNNMALQ